MSSKILNQPPTPKFCKRLWLAFAQNKPFGPCIKEGIKTSPTTIVPLKIIGIPRMLLKDQTSPLITTEAHQGTHRTTTTPNTTYRMHHGGCKTWWSRWTSVAQEPLTADEEEEETLEEEEANMANITINPPTASRITPQT